MFIYSSQWPHTLCCCFAIDEHGVVVLLPNVYFPVLTSIVRYAPEFQHLHKYLFGEEVKSEERKKKTVKHAVLKKRDR